jgi:Xaa-Pro aminopeptidase
MTSHAASLDDRLAGLDRRLAELGCAALLVTAQSAQDPDLAPFVGHPHLGQSLLVVPRGGAPRLGFVSPLERAEAAATGLALLTPDDLEAARWSGQTAALEVQLAAYWQRALAFAGVAPGQVALAGHGPAGVVVAVALGLARAGWSFVPGNALLRALRKRKTDAERAAIRAAARGAGAALREVAGLLAAASGDGENAELWLEGERLTVARVRAALARAFAARGLEQPRGNIVAPAEEGAVPHSAGTDERVLRAGESLIVDVFPRRHLFADCTRTFCAGAPPPFLAAAHAAVAAALARAHEVAAAAAGRRSGDVQEEVFRVLEERGYPTPLTAPGITRGMVHNLGHGVGFELQELPFFRKNNGAEGVIEEGDVFTLEPGLYDPQAGFGLRLEDLVALGPDGLEVFTPFPYALDPRQWAAEYDRGEG